MTTRISRDEIHHLAGGLFLLAMVLFFPWITGSTKLGDDHIRYTIRLALAFYAGAAGLMLGLKPADWTATTLGGQWARILWTLAFVTYAVHVAMAMHHFHHWSHAHAVEHTRQVAGIGEGIYISHLFGLLWGLDAAWWWLAPAGYATRPAVVGWSLHGFMAFIWFNGTVIYEQGLVRWAGLAVFVLLAAIWANSWARRSRPAAS